LNLQTKVVELQEQLSALRDSHNSEITDCRQAHISEVDTLRTQFEAERGSLLAAQEMISEANEAERTKLVAEHAAAIVQMEAETRAIKRAAARDREEALRSVTEAEHNAKGCLANARLTVSDVILAALRTEKEEEHAQKLHSVREHARRELEASEGVQANLRARVGALEQALQQAQQGAGSPLATKQTDSPPRLLDTRAVPPAHGRALPAMTWAAVPLAPGLDTSGSTDPELQELQKVLGNRAGYHAAQDAESSSDDSKGARFDGDKYDLSDSSERAPRTVPSAHSLSSFSATSEEAHVEQSRLARTESQLGKLDVAVANWADATGTALRSVPARDPGPDHQERQYTSTMGAVRGEQHRHLDEGLSRATSKAVAASMAVDRELELSGTMFGLAGSPLRSDDNQHSALEDDLMEI
jgi:hypothetical protein